MVYAYLHESSRTNFASSVAEENAVRAIAAMTEQTAGLEVDELILPENYLQEYEDLKSPQERERDLEETDVDELTEEETEEGSDYSGDEDDGKGKGKTREKAKKPAKGKKPKSKKPKSAGQVLNELVGYSYFRLRF